MALRYPMVDEHGVERAYHRIVRYEVYHDLACIDVTIGSHTTAEVRSDGYLPYITARVRLPITEFTMLDPRADLYVALKAHCATLDEEDRLSVLKAAEDC